MSDHITSFLEKTEGSAIQLIRKENYLSIDYSISYASATVAIIFLQFPENSKKKDTFNQAFEDLEEYAQIRDLVCHLVQKDQIELFAELKMGYLQISLIEE